MSTDRQRATSAQARQRTGDAGAQARAALRPLRKAKAETEARMLAAIQAIEAYEASRKESDSTRVPLLDETPVKPLRKTSPKVTRRPGETGLDLLRRWFASNRWQPWPFQIETWQAFARG